MKHLLTILVFLAAVLFLCSCKHQAQEQNSRKEATFLSVDVDEFERFIADTVNVVVLDVRTQEEYSNGHMKGAVLIDFKEDAFRDECLKLLPRDKQIALYCRFGFRSKSASRILSEEGYKVINLKGGLTGWLKAGKAVVKE